MMDYTPDYSVYVTTYSHDINRHCVYIESDDGLYLAAAFPAHEDAMRFMQSLTNCPSCEAGLDQIDESHHSNFIKSHQYLDTIRNQPKRYDIEDEDF